MFTQLFSEQKRLLNFFFQHLDVKQMNRVLEICKNTKGILVFTGVGKSGIIAQKIAQTLISTGTKSIFLPAADALHGDIGILTEEDLLFCLSKSGNTQELLDLVSYAKKKGAKIICVTSEKNSPLSIKSDLSVYLPLERELCPFNLAPTISTTLQVLFGDVLAIALMQVNNFSLDDYALNHPAGSIGKKISLYVKDIMLKEGQLPIAMPHNTLMQTLSEFTEKKCGCLLIIDEDHNLSGIFTDGDLRRALEKHGEALLQQKLKDLMTSRFKWIEPNFLAWHAVKKMEEDPQKRIMTLPVLEKKKLVGLIHMHDILQSSMR